MDWPITDMLRKIPFGKTEHLPENEREDVRAQLEASMRADHQKAMQDVDREIIDEMRKAAGQHTRGA